jgi:hypothetical protein
MVLYGLCYTFITSQPYHDRAIAALVAILPAYSGAIYPEVAKKWFHPLSSLSITDDIDQL